MYLKYLSNDVILYEIVKYLDILSVINIMLVNKEYYSLINCIYFWDEIFFRELDSLNNQYNFTFNKSNSLFLAKNRYWNLESLKISYVKINGKVFWQPKIGSWVHIGLTGLCGIYRIINLTYNNNNITTEAIIRLVDIEQKKLTGTEKIFFDQESYEWKFLCNIHNNLSNYHVYPSDCLYNLKLIGI